MCTTSCLHRRPSFPHHHPCVASPRRGSESGRNGHRIHAAASGSPGSVVSNRPHSRTRIVTVSPSAATSSALYVGGFPRGHGWSPRLVIQRPISEDLNSGQVVQKVGEISQTGRAAWPGSSMRTRRSVRFNGRQHAAARIRVHTKTGCPPLPAFQSQCPIRSHRPSPQSLPTPGSTSCSRPHAAATTCGQVGNGRSLRAGLSYSVPSLGEPSLGPPGLSSLSRAPQSSQATPALATQAADPTCIAVVRLSFPDAGNGHRYCVDTLRPDASARTLLFARSRC